MAEPAKRNATFEDLQDVPEHLVGAILFGSLYVHPRPAPAHVTAGETVPIELGGPLRQGRGCPGGWIIVPEPVLRLGPRAVQPDHAGWRRERLPHLPATTCFEAQPDGVCDLLAPSTLVNDLGAERCISVTYHVDHILHLDPVARLLEVFRLDGANWVLLETFQDRAEVRAPPFDAVAFALAGLRPLPPAPPSTPA